MKLLFDQFSSRTSKIITTSYSTSFSLGILYINKRIRADIYAIGAVAYEMLTGRPPFVGPTAQSILAAHVTEQVRPVTERREAVTAQLNQIVMKCLEKNPADRWQTADEILPLLEQAATPSGGMTPTNTRPLKASTAKPAVLS